MCSSSDLNFSANWTGKWEFSFILDALKISPGFCFLGFPFPLSLFIFFFSLYMSNCFHVVLGNSNNLRLIWILAEARMYWLGWMLFLNVLFSFRCVVFNAKEVEDKHILSVHNNHHVKLIKNISSKQFDSRRNRIASKFNSIYMNEGSLEAAYLAAGSVIEVIILRHTLYVWMFRVFLYLFLFQGRERNVHTCLNFIKNVVD